MDNDHGMDLTFSVNPRPATHDPLPPAAADRLPLDFTVEPNGTAAEDVSNHEDTPAGNIAFLARFALGGY